MRNHDVRDPPADPDFQDFARETAGVVDAFAERCAPARLLARVRFCGFGAPAVSQAGCVLKVDSTSRSAVSQCSSACPSA